MVVSKIRWGVLGTARIAEQQVIPAIHAAQNSELVAVASRNLAQAEQYADRNRIPRVYGSYQQLLEDRDIDAVYIPLPNGLHHEWSVKAARYKKHVLCEKPAALNAQQMRDIAGIARENGTLFMEAFMYQFHPQWEHVSRILAGNDLGDITLVDSSFSFSLQNRADIRFDGEMGGGALYDVGCYCVHAIRTIASNAQPTEVTAVARFGNQNVDISLSSAMKFANGMLAHFDCSFDTFDRQYLQIAGSRGTMTLNLPFRPDLGSATVTIESNGHKEVRAFEPSMMYVRQVEHFADCVLTGGQPRNTVEDSIMNLEFIEMVYKSAGRAISSSTGGTSF